MPFATLASKVAGGSFTGTIHPGTKAGFYLVRVELD